MTSLMMISLPVFGFLNECHGPPSSGVAPKSSRAVSYPHSMNAPSVNFMMLPLWTRVTESRLLSMAYLIAAFTRRVVPSLEVGLMPKPEVSGKRTFLNISGNASLRSALNFSLSSVPASNSMPA